MATRDLRSEVIEFIAQERGLAPEKVQLSDRLSHDLGMEGDDAVEFFDSLRDRFGTDLTILDENWNKFFQPEGFGLGPLTIIPAAIAGFAISCAVGLGVFGALAIATALLAAYYWRMRRWGPSGPKIPVTVEDVVAAVEAGAWPGRPHA